MMVESLKKFATILDDVIDDVIAIVLRPEIGKKVPPSLNMKGM
jgi:hypothetical protein